MHEGMIFRLGRQRFRVKELQSDRISISSKNAKETSGQITPPSESEELNSVPNIVGCRVCFSTAQSKRNPLISPCNCKGTMKFIHLKCLQHWLDGKIRRKENQQSLQISWKVLECELCKQILPYKVESENYATDYNIIEIEKPNSNYLILEAYQKDSNVIKGLQLINIKEQDKLKLGRGLEVDIRISDISVSRVHATIIHENNHFYLTDQNSKFGTLVLHSTPIPLNSIYTKCGIQIGRSVIAMLDSTDLLSNEEEVILTNPNKKQLEIQIQTESDLQKKNQFIKIDNNVPILMNCIENSNILHFDDPEQMFDVQNKDSNEDLSQNSQDFMEYPENCNNQPNLPPVYSNIQFFSGNNQNQQKQVENDNEKELETEEKKK